MFLYLLSTKTLLVRFGSDTPRFSSRHFFFIVAVAVVVVVVAVAVIVVVVVVIFTYLHVICCTTLPTLIKARTAMRLMKHKNG